MKLCKIELEVDEKVMKPIIHLFGRDDDGIAWHRTDDTFEPHFFIDYGDGSEIDKKEYFKRRETTTRKTLFGTPVENIVTYVPTDVPVLRDLV
jgi:hypothetical protein